MSRNKKSSDVFIPVGYSVGRFVQSMAMFVASDFLHNSDRSILAFSASCLVLAAAVFLTAQQAWGATKTLTRRQMSVLIVNGVLIYITFVLFSFGLKCLGPLPSVVCDFANAGIPFASALAIGSTVQPDKKRGVLAMLAGYLIVFFTAPVSVHDRFRLLSASAAAAATPNTAAAALAVPLPSDALIAGNPAILVSLNSTAAASVHSYHIGWFTLSETSVGIIACLLMGAFDIYRTRYVKRVSMQKDFRGKKRLHALSVGCAALISIPVAMLHRFVQIASDATTTIAASTTDDSIAASTATAAANVDPASASAMSTGGQVWSIVLIVLFYVALKFYMDSQVFVSATSSAVGLSGVNPNGAVGAGSWPVSRSISVQFNFLVVFISSCFIDLYRGELGLTAPTVAAALIVYYGLHNLLSSASFLPLYTTDTSSLALPTSGSGAAESGDDHRPASSLMSNGSGSEPASSGAGSRNQLRGVLRHIMEQRSTRRIFLFLCINFSFMFVELSFGLWTNSLGLISDAGHMLFDCAALGIGLYASYISTIKEDEVYTYGYSRYKVLSGFVNGVLLLYIAFFIFVEAIERLFEPEEIHSERLFLVSFLGLGVNLIGLFFFSDVGHGHSHDGPGGGHGGGSKHAHAHDGECKGDHDVEAGGHHHADDRVRTCFFWNLNANDRGVFLHMLGDALGSVGVIISSFLISQFGWTLADPICSLIISAMIVGFVMPLITETAMILLQHTPEVKHDQLRGCLVRIQQLDGVLEYRHPRFWAHSEDKLVGTLHVIVNERADQQQILRRVCAYLKEAPVSIHHVTVQIETPNGGVAASAAAGGITGFGNTPYSQPSSPAAALSSHVYNPYSSISSPAAPSSSSVAAAASVASDAVPRVASITAPSPYFAAAAAPSSLAAFGGSTAASMLQFDPLQLLQPTSTATSILPNSADATAPAPAASTGTFGAHDPSAAPINFGGASSVLFGALPVPTDASAATTPSV